MNRKTKKKVLTVVVVLFFLTAGAGYLLWENGFQEKKQTTKELTGVWDEIKSGVTVTPASEPGDQNEEPKDELVVYVCGAVNQPGIYSLAAGSRLYEALALAGGFSAEADPAYHNLARSVADGERIYILSIAETEALAIEQQMAGEEGVAVNAAEDGCINLNTASTELLMELPGIGEAKAEAILQYRAKIGKFTAIEEIMNVSGIGEAMFEKIKDKITVK